MTVEYQKVWRTMNDLELVTSKICSAREIIDNAIDAIQEHKSDKAELLMTAAYEYLEYYLKEFDEKFKDAWQATVGDLRDGDKEVYDAVMKERDHYEGKAPLSCDKDDPSPECKGAWDSFWEDLDNWSKEPQQYTEEELNAMCDKAELDNKHFQEPFTTDIGTVSQNGVTFQEYRKAQVIVNYSGSIDSEKEHYQKIVDKYEGKKTLNHDEAIAAGWEMTDDGFWIKEDKNSKYKNQNGVTYIEYVKAKIEANSDWNDGWTKEHYQKIVDKYEGKFKEVKKWVLPVEQVHDDYFVTFPQDLLEAAKLKEGDVVEWVDNSDGTYTIRHKTMSNTLNSDEC